MTTHNRAGRALTLNGMPLKIRVMPDCIVITAQNTCELWGCVEGLSIAPINRKKVALWLKAFPGALNDTGDRAGIFFCNMLISF